MICRFLARRTDNADQSTAMRTDNGQNARKDGEAVSVKGGSDYSQQQIDKMPFDDLHST